MKPRAAYRVVIPFTLTAESDPTVEEVLHVGDFIEASLTDALWFLERGVVVLDEAETARRAAQRPTVTALA